MNTYNRERPEERVIRDGVTLAKQLGHRFIQLIVLRKSKPQGLDGRMRVVSRRPQLFGKCVGSECFDDTWSCLAEVTLADAESFIAHRDRWRGK